MDIKFKDLLDTFFIDDNGCESQVVHLHKDDSMRFYGVVYPISRWTKQSGHEAGWAYNSNSSGGLTHDDLNDDCDVLFEFIFCWRGVWEGRIYFPDDEEYWSSDLHMIANVWDLIELHLKQRIIKDNPDYDAFDD